MRVLSERCPHNVKKGNEHEQIQKSIACNLALSIPRRMGTEVPVQSASRGDRKGGLSVRDDVLPAVGM
jgi:hypothetical protein